MLKAALLKVFELAGSETDHIPPVMVRFSYIAFFFSAIVNEIINLNMLYYAV